jgi:hypothetical protein
VLDRSELLLFSELLQLLFTELLLSYDLTSPELATMSSFELATMSSFKLSDFLRSGGPCGATTALDPPAALHPPEEDFPPAASVVQVGIWNSGCPVDVTQRWYMLLFGSTIRGFLITSGIGKKQ